MMNPDRETALFELALKMPVDKRQAFVAAVSEGEPVLGRRLEALLAAREQTEGIPGETPGSEAPTMKNELLDAADQAIGQKIGRYRILEKVGEGGCGVVYVAEQTEPVHRRVALKVIKLGMDTKQVVARFEAERQALAMMDHPNIAKVLDAGATETGRPYFVMELVRGIRITEYCDQNNLTTKERLELFIPVCQAIQHAHQKGIIHRDIKPSNILVTLHDGVPVPKVIDFGIAKATEGRLTDATVYTQLHQFIGTPAYMSPEQAEMSGLDVDTRSDIYSLGVLLYELMTGKTPFDSQELISQGIDAMRRTIREKDPIRPSTRLATLKGEELTTTAKRRSVDSSKLAHQLRGDLDWIVMKCLEKDRRRRYETANGLAADLKRHLNHEVVTARPPSTVYRFQSAVRRHRMLFAAGGGLVLVLLLGVIGTTIGLVQARRARALALQTRGDAEKLSNFMLEDFYAKLEPIGQLDMVAELARRAVAYYDGLPASLRTPETERNRDLAQARLALIMANEGDAKNALTIASAALSRLERMRERGNQGEPTLFGMGLALYAQGWSYRVLGDRPPQLPVLQRGVELLKPLASSAQGSPRVKLLYADFLGQLSHFQPVGQRIPLNDEAMRVLAGLGALDWSNLTAASAWADDADTEARDSLMIGRLDDAERLEKQTQTLAEGVLARRPGDLQAMKDLSEAAEVLALVEAHRFHEAEALELSAQAQRAVEDYVRFNPSDEGGWVLFGLDHFMSAAMSFRLGRVTEALQKARAAISANKRSWTLLRTIAEWEAQRSNRAAAEEALLQASRSLDAYLSRMGLKDQARAFMTESQDEAGRRVKMAFGEDQAAYTMAQSALDRVEKQRQDTSDPNATRRLLLLEADALADSARTALNLGRYTNAETAAQALLSLHELEDDFSEAEGLFNRAGDGYWGRVLLAQAILAQGRANEALEVIQPALAHYREAQVRGATHVSFRQHFARGLYAQALAEPHDDAGRDRSRMELAEATRLLQGLSAEARQLHESTELLGWIEAARNKVSPETPRAPRF